MMIPDLSPNKYWGEFHTGRYANMFPYVFLRRLADVFHDVLNLSVYE